MKTYPIAMVTALFGVALTPAAVLAVDPPVDSGSVLDSVRQPVEPPAPRPGLDIERPAERVTPATPAGRTFEVRDFALSGNTVFDSATLGALLDRFKGAGKSLAVLEEAADEIKAYYRSRGYFLAQALLPAGQNLNDGVVRIEILEGRFGKVDAQVAPGTRLDQAVIDRVLGTIRSGSIVTERTIEQPLLLLNDMPGMVVHSTLTPGAATGESDLQVNVSDDGRRFDGSLTLDNWGSRFTGEWRLAADANMRNPTGLGDLFSMKVLAAQAGGTTLGRIGYTVPVGGYGTRLSLAYSNLHYEVGEEFASLQSEGKADIFNFSVIHPIIRTQNTNVFALGGVDRKKLRDERLGSDDTRRKLTNLRLGMLADTRDTFFGGGLSTVSIGAVIGDHKIESPVDLALDQGASGYNTDGRFEKYNIEAQRLQTLTSQLSLLVGLTAQLAGQNLTTTEQLYLGGPRGVRAFPVGEASGDEGVTGSIELRYLIPGVSIFGAALQVSPFYDIGHVTLRKNPLATDINRARTLSAYGIGFGAGKLDAFSLRIDVAFPGSGGDPISDERERDPRFWASLVTFF